MANSMVTFNNMRKFSEDEIRFIEKSSLFFTSTIDYFQIKLERLKRLQKF